MDVVTSLATFYLPLLTSSSASERFRRPRHHRPRWFPLFTGGAARQPLAPTAASIGAFFLLLRYEQPASSGFSFRKNHFLRSGFRIDLKDSCYRGAFARGGAHGGGGDNLFPCFRVRSRCPCRRCQTILAKIQAVSRSPLFPHSQARCYPIWRGPSPSCRKDRRSASRQPR